MKNMTNENVIQFRTRKQVTVLLSAGALLITGMRDPIRHPRNVGCFSGYTNDKLNNLSNQRLQNR